jgi:hypothetical protein
MSQTNLTNDWKGTPPANGVLDVENSHEFFRLWSTLNFLFCVPEVTPGEGTLAESIVMDSVLQIVYLFISSDKDTNMND